MSDYAAFIAGKSQDDRFSGFEPIWTPDFLFDFQAMLVEWAIRKGKSAVFADCGLGKTPIQLVWAENVVRHTNGSVLILTPLAVASQTMREAEKFGITAHRSVDGTIKPGINIANYQRLHLFDPNDVEGVVCDESSILKAFDGVTRAAITEFMRTRPYRLLCTATAAPNDYVELGTSSEAIGDLGYMDMLSRFFKNDQNSANPNRLWSGGAQWRFKGHAETPFWRWVCSWARAMRRPSDAGFEDGAFILPELAQREHIIEARTLKEGMLFATPAVGLREQREERRRTIKERCEKVAELVTDTGEPAICWCHLNEEGDRITRLIPDAIQVSGKDPDDEKEEKFLAFSSGDARVLVTKPVIGAWGMNWQHCRHMTFFPSHSFEQYYQGVRRCWRFGQTDKVVVDSITSDGERRVLENLQRKATSADEMMSSLIGFMNDADTLIQPNQFTAKEEAPAWL